MKILLLANFGMGLYKFRKELLEELISKNHTVYISYPKDEYVPKLQLLGCQYIESQLERRGTNPLTDLNLLLHYMKMINRIKPDIVLTYTIKPNVYGGIACRLTKTPYIPNITGLGTSIENKGFLQTITVTLYRIALKNASCIFFQNETNRKFFMKHSIVRNKTKLIPGSGVNVGNHQFEDYPENEDSIKFLFIGRIMKAKGIEELLLAAKKVKALYPQVQFDLLGGIEEDYKQQLAELDRLGTINYHGQQEDVHFFIKNSHATILPSHHEGTANVLLESAATGRPVLASRVPGCTETFDEEVSGIGFEVKNVDSLVDAIIKFIHLPFEKKKEMGVAGRRKMEKEFNRKIVIQSYLEEIDKLIVKEFSYELI